MTNIYYNCSNLNTRKFYITVMKSRQFTVDIIFLLILICLAMYFYQNRHRGTRLAVYSESTCIYTLCDVSKLDHRP